MAQDLFASTQSAPYGTKIAGSGSNKHLYNL